MSAPSPILLPNSRGLDRLTDIMAPLQARFECEQFYFLRHGQTECNARKIFQTPEEPLNAIGISQAERAAEALAAEAITTIVCSDMHRTRHTAQVVAKRHALAPIDTIHLRERNFGVLIGTSSLEINWDCAPHNGETLDEFAHRVYSGLHEALEHPGPVLIVAHGGILYVLAALLRIAVTPELLGNAHPLRFTRRNPDAWEAVPLLEPVDAAINLA